MARLAIVDQREIQVPFDFSRSVGIYLAFNGEIYNWRELRAELSDGTPWETECDAEVIARAFRKWGPACLHRFNGMFGIALVDVERGVFFLARDRAGEKPIYYQKMSGGFSFASEAKALPGPKRPGYCPEVEVFEFDCLGSTPFLDVKCLGPGEFILARHATDLAAATPMNWWALPSDVDESLTFPAAVDEAEYLLRDAIALRAVSEVPVGVQLSGGLDSAIVQAVVRSERLYTVTFPEDGVDNLPLARAASLGLAEPQPITFGYRDLLEWLPKIAYHLDTPATWTAVCQWAMNGKMAKDGIVVVFSGEGADELFGGYTRYRILRHVEGMRVDPRLDAYRALLFHVLGDDVALLSRMIDRSKDGSHREEAEAIVRVLSRGLGLVNDAGRVDFYTTMQVLLRMADRMSAAFGMENRAPFLDFRIMEFASRLPSRFKVTEQGSKVVLMEVARRLGVPAAVVDQTTKSGLFVPWAKWRPATTPGGSRGEWDRSSFRDLMFAEWAKAFFGDEAVSSRSA
jgi:asparagine synthase (glutamine-hydrolysing)